MICDTHTHSIYSFDGNDSIEALCRAAVSNGVDILTITDHSEALSGVPLNNEERERCSNSVKFAAEAARTFAPNLTVLRGCELGQPHMNPEYSNAILSSFDFDYVIGSMHLFPGNIDLYDVTYTRENYREYMNMYFEETLKMLDFDGYQTLGHLDYITRLLHHCFDGTPNYLEYRSDVEKILKRVAEKGLALEVNTSSLRKKGALSMEQWILETFAGYGGKLITIGSDAHFAPDVGNGFYEAFELIGKCGFSNYTYFVNKEPVSVPIPR